MESDGYVTRQERIRRLEERVEKVEMELGAQTYEIVIFTFLNYKVIHCKKRGDFQNLQQEILRIFFKLY